MNKNTLNPPLSPLLGGLFISSSFEGVMGGDRGVEREEREVGWLTCI